MAPLTKSLSDVNAGSRRSSVFTPIDPGQPIQANRSGNTSILMRIMSNLFRSVTLSPIVTNLDTIRKEHLPNGAIIERSTREWATKLILPSTGANARCDIVNGGRDRITSLLVPRHLYEEVLEEVSKYKLRLNPMEKREARFRDSIPGLPEVIQIDTSVRQSLDFLDRMALEEVWKPPSLTNQHNPQRRRDSPNNGKSNPWKTPGRENTSVWILPEATEDPGGLGISTSGMRKRIKTGTWTRIDGRDRSLRCSIIKRCKAGFRNDMIVLRLRAWYIPKPGSVNDGNRSSDSQVVSWSCWRTELRITSW